MASPNDSQRPPSSFPPAMGPGARPVSQRDTRSVLQEVAMIRSKYSWSSDADNLTLGYENNGFPRTFQIPFNTLHLGTVSGWLFYGGPIRTRVTSTLIIDTLRSLENAVGRPMTQIEAESLAYHIPQRIKYAQGGTLFGFGFGYYLAWRGKNEMKFPFMKPKPLEQYNNFPNRYLPVLRGNFARIMWHITRGNIYAGITLLCFQPIFAALGTWSTVYGMSRDGRLANVHQALNRLAGNRIGMITENERQTYPQQRSQQQTTDQQYSESDAQGYYSDPAAGAGNEYGGGQNYAGDNNYTDHTTDTNTLGDPAMRNRENQQRSPTAPSRSSRTPSRPAQVQQPDSFDRSSSSDFLFNDDDASPTAGNGPDPGHGQCWVALSSTQRGQHMEQN